MTVHFIGAGPGAPDLITVRGLGLIRRSRVVLYAGSLVPEEVVAEAGAEAPGGSKVIEKFHKTGDQVALGQNDVHRESYAEEIIEFLYATLDGAGMRYAVTLAQSHQV